MWTVSSNSLSSEPQLYIVCTGPCLQLGLGTRKVPVHPCVPCSFSLRPRYLRPVSLRLSILRWIIVDEPNTTTSVHSHPQRTPATTLVFASFSLPAYWILNTADRFRGGGTVHRQAKYPVVVAVTWHILRYLTPLSPWRTQSVTA